MATIQQIEPQVTFSSEPVEIPFSAQSTDDGDLTFEISGQPSGIYVSQEKRIIYGSPIQGTYKEYIITLTAKEGSLPDAEVEFTLAVMPTLFLQTENLPPFLDETTYPTPYAYIPDFVYYGASIRIRSQRYMAENMARNQEGPANMLFSKWWQNSLHLVEGVSWDHEPLTGLYWPTVEFTNQRYQGVGAKFEAVAYYASAPIWTSPNKKIVTYTAWGEPVATVTTTTTYSYRLTENTYGVTFDKDVVVTGEFPDFATGSSTVYEVGQQLDPTSFIQNAIDNQRADYNLGKPSTTINQRVGNDTSYTDTGGGVDRALRYEFDLAARLPAHGFGIGYREATDELQIDQKWYQHVNILQFSDDPLDPDVNFEDFLGVKKQHQIIECDFEGATLLTDSSGEQFYHVNLRNKIPTLSSTELMSLDFRTDYSDDTPDPAHYRVFDGAIPANTKDWNSLSPSDSYDSITVL